MSRNDADVGTSGRLPALYRIGRRPGTLPSRAVLRRQADRGHRPLREAAVPIRSRIRAAGESVLSGRRPRPSADSPTAGELDVDAVWRIESSAPIRLYPADLVEREVHDSVEGAAHLPHHI